MERCPACGTELAADRGRTGVSAPLRLAAPEAEPERTDPTWCPNPECPANSTRVVPAEDLPG